VLLRVAKISPPILFSFLHRNYITSTFLTEKLAPQIIESFPPQKVFPFINLSRRVPSEASGPLFIFFFLLFPLSNKPSSLFLSSFSFPLLLCLSRYKSFFPCPKSTFVGKRVNFHLVTRIRSSVPFFLSISLVFDPPVLVTPGNPSL